MKLLITTLAVIISIAFFNNCNTTEPPPIIPPDDTIANTITLTVEWTDLYRINVKWNKSLQDTLVPFTYLLTQTDEQGNKTTKQFTITGKDTNYTAGEPDSLQQGKTYKFFVEAFNKDNKLKDTSKTVAGKTLSPTSHDIVWQIDTLGQAGNFLRDVWGTDENNIWAVGGINLPEGGTTIIKWDGSNWNLHSYPDGSAYAIWGNSENDIWVVGEWANRGFLGHFNGSSWTEYKSDYFYNRGDTVYPLRSVWGSAPDDVWAVGDLGTIIHWDGVQWIKENNIASSFGQYRFTDIWGFNKNEIYAAGRIYQDSVLLLKYNGTNWETIIRKASLTSFATVWGPHSNLVYFVEYNNYLITNKTANQFILPGRTASTEKIRGNGSNNIFTVGHFGEVFHYNGLQWKKMTELNSTYLESSALTGCYVTDNQVIIVGITPIGAISIRGIIQ